MNADQAHSFSSNAMNTDFHIAIADITQKYAGQAALNAFMELESVERFLSSYIESSDISQINSLSRGEHAVVSPVTFECLEIAEMIRRQTDGVFDAAYRSRSRRPLKDLITLDRDNLTVRVNSDVVELDLGGIGKGFGLDRMADLLQEWGIKSYLLRASYSTALAGAAPLGAKGWDAGFGSAENRQEVWLENKAISGSGVEMQGEHIFDARTGGATGRYRSWAVAESGAVADALSTAFMIMEKEDIRRHLRKHRSRSAWIQETPDTEIVSLLIE